MNKKQRQQWAQIAEFLLHISTNPVEILLQSVGSDAKILEVWSTDTATYRKEATLPFFSKNILAEKATLLADQLVLDTTITPTKKAATLLIREEGKLIGLFSIIQDFSAYQAAAASLLSLVQLDSLLEERPTALTPGSLEEPTKLIPEIIQEVLLELQLEGQRKYNKKQKLAILAELKKRGVFHTKGGVAETSKLLAIPEPSMYRYLASLT
ncbi:hypothetical protein BAU15_13810 [Enterococcus sp. JM4C]|uniref:helix-turn-helix domain-containing protein n=1 Tax=Candidatus Enterococcus huntleyi TaxID=1857217 RepID=UPI00137B18ED|nr:helix-turn-helix domain-containing protein [Enterococcus sp. JM4C]KAF1298348.1 hypothetical protein BAU15_13810 [Enterococcus sp. JM4C]